VPWRLAAGIGAIALLATSTGDVFVVVALVGVAASPWAAAATAAAAVATVARWGTADLGLVAGGQAVLGPAVATGPVLAALGSGLAAVAVVVGVARSSPPDVVAVTLAGAAAAAVAVGPASSTPADGGMRIVGLLLGVGAAWLAAERLERVPPWAGAAIGLVAVLAAVLA
jgi:hypothetical protein